MTSVIYIRDTDFSWRAGEVVHEVAKGPHQLVRLDVLGPYFPDRDATPFVRVVDGRRRSEALMTDVAPDNSHLRGYFPVDVPLRGRIEFGYASQVLGSLAIREGTVRRLDPERIDTPVHRVTARALGAFAV